jgi:hypothetical protein
VSPTPGIPERFTRPTPRVEIETTPVSVPPPGTVRVSGSFGRLTLPLALLLSVGSAIGARLLPTSTNTDVAVERAAVAAERDRLEQERFREELRQSIRGVTDRLDRLETRISLLESASAARPKP